MILEAKLSDLQIYNLHPDKPVLNLPYMFTLLFCTGIKACLEIEYEKMHVTHCYLLHQLLVYVLYLK